MRLPRHRPGLRGRLIAALVACVAVALGAAALALLQPLEHRLRANELRTLRATVLSAQASFDIEVPVRRGQPDLKRAARALARRTGARVALVDGHLRPVVSTDPDVPDLYQDVSRVAASGHQQASIGREGTVDVARVVVPVHIGGAQYYIAARKGLNEPRSAVRVVQRAFLAAGAVGLGVALIAGVGLATTLLRRLSRMRDAALEMAEVGPAVEVAPDPTRDEIGDLSRAFATMQGRLRHQEEARRAFVATASHELRTPLASLQGTLELLQEDLGAEAPDLDDARERVERAREQARRLARLASDLLDLSRIDADVSLRREPVELAELARAVCAEFEPALSERRVRLALPELGRPLWARADPGAVARIVRILVDNAVRLSPPGQAVRVELGGEDGAVSMTVSDRGPGVPAHERELIFQRFQRGSTAGAGSGFGLGLAIGRELATRMGGSLDLDPGHAPGARFTVRLPAAARPAR